MGDTKPAMPKMVCPICVAEVCSGKWLKYAMPNHNNAGISIDQK